MKYLQMLVMLLIYSSLFGQDEVVFQQPLKVTANKRINSDLKQGTVFYLTSLQSKKSDNGIAYISLTYMKNDSIKGNFDLKKLEECDFMEIDNIGKAWDRHLLTRGTYPNLLAKGYQYELRNEMNSDAQTYLNSLFSSNLFFNDTGFEDYLISLLDRVHERLLYDGRPGAINIRLLKDPKPDAFSLTNGCIVLTTGMLSVLQTEDELVAIMAHQVAHFVSDHQLLNYNAAVDRNMKAETWSKIATSVAVGTDIFLSATNRNFISGIIPAVTSDVSSAIAYNVNRMLGTNFTLSQDADADQVARELLLLLGYDQLALPAALQRIHDYYTLTNNFHILISNSNFSNLPFRINDLGKVNNIDSVFQISFLKRVSYINSFNAATELWVYDHYAQADDLAGRNIELGVATESDYIVKAIVKRRLAASPNSNDEALWYLNEAKKLSASPSAVIFKEEGITLARMNRNADAKQAFESYLRALTDQKSGITAANNQTALFNEISWTQDMIRKMDTVGK